MGPSYRYTRAPSRVRRLNMRVGASGRYSRQSPTIDESEWSYGDLEWLLHIALTPGFDGHGEWTM